MEGTGCGGGENVTQGGFRGERKSTKMIFKDEPLVEKLLGQNDGWLQKQSKE